MDIYSNLKNTSVTIWGTGETSLLLAEELIKNKISIQTFWSTFYKEDAIWGIPVKQLTQKELEQYSAHFLSIILPIQEEAFCNYIMDFLKANSSVQYIYNYRNGKLERLYP